MDEFKEYLVECGLSDLSIRQYVSMINVALKRKKVTAILSDTSKSSSTRNAYWCALKKWAAFKEDLELLQELEKPSVRKSIRAIGDKLPAKTTPLSDDEYKAFMGALDTWKEDTGWLWPVVSLMVSLGLRAGVDLCGLRREALVASLESGVIALQTKRGKVRRLPSEPIQEEMNRLLTWKNWSVLAELIVDTKKPGSLGHLRSAYANVVKAVKLVAERAGLDPTKIKTHRFRHNFAKYVYENTEHDLLLTQQALGHSSPNTTQIYVSPNEEKLANVLSKRGK